MSKKEELRKQRAKTVINVTSSRQEKNLMGAVRFVENKLKNEFPGIMLEHETQWKLCDIISNLKKTFTDIDFHCYFPNTSMRPDGGILSIVDKNKKSFPILISEKKNQGTNDLRKKEGKKKQAKGNAIERLGKNVIGFRTALKDESIFPFVCFGDGCDFADDSSILDRVVTIAQFGKLNKIYLFKLGACGEFDRGTFYFREKEWTKAEMENKLFLISKRSIYYYFSKYGKSLFI